MDTVGRTKTVILIIFCLVLMGNKPIMVDSTKLPQQDQSRIVEQKVKTRYDVFGRPVNQSQTAKGYHPVVGTVKLVSGAATITLNTSTTDGKQDVSFISKYTFRGHAYSLDTANTKTYRVIPVSATQAVVRSNDGSDTSTVQFVLEGE